MAFLVPMNKDNSLNTFLSLDYVIIYLLLVLDYKISLFFSIKIAYFRFSVSFQGPELIEDS